MKNKNFTRRDFIKATGAVTAGVILAPSVACASSAFDSKGLPTIILGKTGVRIPLMVMGLGSRFMAVDEEKGHEILETALNNGFYYWDTAASYKNNTQFSEERIGKILSPIRSKIFLSSKVGDRKADDAKRTVETSLKRLNTDYIDLYQIHSITTEDEVKQFGAADGVLPVLQKYKEQGIIRHIGFTGHTSAIAMKLAAEMHDFDTMLIALNHQQKGEKFEENPVQFAASKGMGVLAMKTIRPRETVTSLKPDDLIRYALSLKGVTAAVVGIDKKELVTENAEIVKNFKPFDAEKMNSLRAELKPFYKSKTLPWMQP
ncbi:MAG: aldo/keto reductase, partial [Bacteroidales bacterium]|nr:aldo/keto reductase [Bacteroidales bacterium]